MEEIGVAIQSILAHKMRSILTMLGVIIGIAAIISIFSIIEGNTANMKKEMIGGSNNTMEVEYDKKSSFDPSLRSGKEEQKPSYLPEIGEEQLKKVRQVPDVIDAGLAYQTEANVYRQASKAQSKVSAVTPNIDKLKRLKILKGEGFDSKDFKENKQIIYLDQTLYEELFKGQDGIGQYVEVKGVPFEVKGVFKAEEEGDSPYSFVEKEAYIPLKQAYKIFSEIDIAPKVIIQSTDTDKLQIAASKVAGVLNKEIPKSDYVYGVRNMEELQKSLEQFNQSNFILLAGIASISLLVGGIGVMNIMLVSVTERTREIGVKKALGARRKVILKQFLVEAVVITLLGGILGVLIGLLGGFIITRVLEYPYIVSIISVVASLAFCCIIGIIFGLLPAMKASKLDPIEALRFE
ncbi:ABC transporter permease [Enterococcus sp. AZ192]|uniref:ABC transporter permease n=1 Tax=unclassified Enterococcus TaxID=2608891 RepID=UPI003D2BD854